MGGRGGASACGGISGCTDIDHMLGAGRTDVDKMLGPSLGCSYRPANSGATTRAATSRGIDDVFRVSFYDVLGAVVGCSFRFIDSRVTARAATPRGIDDI